MKIAIIGAGLAGLTAASRLSAAGHEVDVLEKSRGAGGRMSTRREPWASLDLGAQYFTARSPAFREQVARWLRGGVAARWRFTPRRIEGGVLRPSPDATRRYVGLPGMNAPARSLGKGVRLITGARVRGLERQGPGWRLLGEAIDADDVYDWVISSAPAEQARELLAGTALGARISPDPHTPCWAVALATRGEVDERIQGIFGDDLVSWAARQSRKPGRSAPSDCDDVWVLHFSPTWSRDNGKETSLDPAALGADWLQAALGARLEIRHRYRHYWRYANSAGDGNQGPCLVDPRQQLAAIGAWCLGGKVEDAWLSGQALAERLLATRGHRACIGGG